ncbi:MAG: N-acetylmuramoyl-L-alanine amidase [Chloroflexi bacterium]|nr:N-acetylmuramoyl-L-alanine amidase [Chloroflexota bacterium]
MGPASRALAELLGTMALAVVLLGCQVVVRADPPQPAEPAAMTAAPAEAPAADDATAPADAPTDSAADSAVPEPGTPAAAEPAVATDEPRRPPSSEAAPAPEAPAELAAPGAPVPALADEPPGVVWEPTAPPVGRLRTIAVDPGHGGPEVGATSGSMAEKNVNLQIALILAEMLANDGFRVVLTRDGDRAVHPEYVQSGVRGQLTRDLQARVAIANRQNADLFLAIHNNGSGDPGQRGTEVWYNRLRPFADHNLALAELVLDGIVQHLRAIGYPTVNRGVKDDTYFRFFRGRPFNIYVLGPGDGPRPHVPTAMPGVLGESLFLSNPADAAALRRPETLAAIARGYRDAVLGYFERFAD